MVTAVCDECAEPVHDDDAAPSCGAHVLHLECRAWFTCRACDEEWQEATSE